MSFKADAEYHGKWRAAHRESINARARLAYWTNLSDSRKAARERMQKSYQANPAHRERRKLTAWTKSLWILYRLTPDEYKAIFKFQDGTCAGCGKTPTGKRLAVDHDHKTGRIRGLLCWLCNRALGLIADNARAATNLGAYLYRPTAPVALGKETYGLIGKAKANKKKKVYGPPSPGKE